MRISTLRTLSTQEMDLGHPRQGTGEGLSRPLCPCSPPRPRVSHRKQVPPEPGGERDGMHEKEKATPETRCKLAASGAHHNLYQTTSTTR